jgi:hypothetical protein
MPDTQLIEPAHQSINQQESKNSPEFKHPPESPQSHDFSESKDPPESKDISESTQSKDSPESYDSSESQSNDLPENAPEQQLASRASQFLKVDLPDSSIGLSNMFPLEAISSAVIDYIKAKTTLESAKVNVSTQVIGELTKAVESGDQPTLTRVRDSIFPIQKGGGTFTFTDKDCKYFPY